MVGLKFNHSTQIWLITQQTSSLNMSKWTSICQTKSASQIMLSMKNTQTSSKNCWVTRKDLASQINTSAKGRNLLSKEVRNMAASPIICMKIPIRTWNRWRSKYIFMITMNKRFHKLQETAERTLVPSIRHLAFHI